MDNELSLKDPLEILADIAVMAATDASPVLEERINSVLRAFRSMQSAEPIGEIVKGGAGMSLRQYYAGKALPAVIAADVAQGGDAHPNYIASLCIQYADVLISQLEE